MVAFAPHATTLFLRFRRFKTQFLGTQVPKLKQSLSLTLKHYIPFAGNILYPLIPTEKPSFRYVEGDSVPFTVSESTNDFDSLVGYGPRDADQFYDYVPHLPPKSCREPLGIGTVSWNQIRHVPLHASTFPLPKEKVRTTYVLHESDIKKLKDSVMSKKPGITYLSSFVTVAAYMWSTIVISGDSIGEQVDESRDEYFIFPVDVRARVDPPVPGNYIGNCTAPGRLKMRHGVLAGDEGFFAAAEAMSYYIQNTVNNKERVLEGAENWLSDFKKMKGGGTFGVSESPKFDLYSVDFGWGEARKVEVPSIDWENHTMSMCKPRDSERGIEVGLSLPTPRMEAFAALFAHGLQQSR
ncbi:malonyl-coenzyme A:anthocyanin 3-O-glucoside-6''-O-malonyltransferase-like [Dorcoceras hygrometricum]|uniref:Malonyl-coenzyme A:anthocyanin 3-O-glucoside-6''-O-malonyltransferase-like n=1 Tax=Dorcoceras hygrometricum TaxID=472368 RepID=A0A2Z7B737_9LAMI|nr:malonyl-coenzyme A:anthocyanin 3-O-glucoside-6''-O-malonyltransferase-like [Dorcoceras hygrometricum]